MTGLPPTRLNELRNSTFAAFDRLIAYALKSRPDFMLIVGDLYDGEDRSLRAQLKFQQGMERLCEAGIPVYITYGNHDHLGGSWTRFELPSNVYEFNEQVKGETLIVRGQEVVLHGFSYPQRHVRQEMISQFPVALDRHSFHIGLLHGSPAGTEGHAVYSPFTIAELQTKQYDYWALGHIHTRQHLCEEPPIIYPGNIQGRHRNESGVKGFYEVELSKSETKLAFIPTTVIQFATLQVPCSTVRHANEFLKICQETIESFIVENGPSIIDLEILQMDAETAAFYERTSEAIWLDALREVLETSEPFVWVQRITSSNVSSSEQKSNLLIESVFEQMDNWSMNEWNDVLGDVYQNVRTMRYLDELTEESVQDIRERVERLLLNEMPSVK